MSGWDRSLETGIAEIDDQHRRIFAEAEAPAAAFAHAVVREEDEKELARVTTAWAPR